MWMAKLKDGNIVGENDSKWSEIKDSIETLFYNYDGLLVNLPPLKGKIKGYLQYKSASASLLGGNIDIDSQTIGVILENDTKILLNFSFKNKKIDIIIE